MGKACLTLALALITLVTAGCGAAPSEHAAALRRWEASAPPHYLLRTVENLRGSRCAQIVEVRDEQLVQILNNTCRHPSLWTVSWLFRKAVSPGSPAEICTRSVAGVGCLCHQRVVRHVEYDAQQGFPVRIQIVQTWSRSWLEAGFWQFTFEQRALPNCTPPSADIGWTIMVRELRPLP